MQLLEISMVAVASLGTIVLAVGRRPAFASLRAKWLGQQHYAHPIPTLVFAALVPVYGVINATARGRKVLVPELVLDRAIPVEPVWILVYVSMWVFAFLPAFVVREVELRHRSVLAYLS